MAVLILGLRGKCHSPATLLGVRGGWGLGAGLDGSGKSRPYRGSNPGPSSQ
jgi:hypothetical protein